MSDIGILAFAIVCASGGAILLGIVQWLMLTRIKELENRSGNEKD